MSQRAATDVRPAGADPSTDARQPVERKVRLTALVVLLALECVVGAVLRPAYSTLLPLLVGLSVVLLTTAWLAAHRRRVLAVALLLAALVRLPLAIAFDVWPPTLDHRRPDLSFERVEGAVYADETYYLREAARIAEGSPPRDFSTNQYVRTAWFEAQIMRMAGGALHSLRLVNSFIGAFAAMILLAAVLRVHPLAGRRARAASVIAAVLPLPVLWSVLVIKEGYLFFGLSLALLGLMRVYQRRLVAIGLLLTAMGTAIVFFHRPANAAIPIVGVVAAFVTGSSRRRRRTRAFVPVAIGAAVAVIGLAVVTPAALATSVAPQEAALFGREVAELPAVPGYGAALGLPEPLRSTALFVYLLASPVITTVGSLVPVFGTPSWYVFSTSMYALTWWLLLPLLVRAIWRAWRMRSGWWLFWGAVAITWTFYAASARQGLGFDAFRYRDALLPVFVLLVGSSLLLQEPSPRAAGAYRAWIGAIAMLILGWAVLR